MVSEFPRRRKTSEYSLNAVHRLAANGKVAYGSNDVQKDIDNLRFSLDDVCNCLQSLSVEDYKQSVNYDDHKGWLDVYLCKWSLSKNSSANTEKLYIKLKLNRDCITIVLASFHPEGAL